MLIGYMRVSTGEQNLDLQRDALEYAWRFRPAEFSKYVLFVFSSRCVIGLCG
jgi:DNA invertase Pin-like site-specific DNA recombinase